MSQIEAYIRTYDVTCVYTHTYVRIYRLEYKVLKSGRNGRKSGVDIVLIACRVKVRETDRGEASNDRERKR